MRLSQSTNEAGETPGSEEGREEVPWTHQHVPPGSPIAQICWKSERKGAWEM